MNFVKGQRFQTADGAWFTIIRVTDTSAIKDKTYKALRKAFNKGSRYSIRIMFDSSAPDWCMFNEISLSKIITSQ